MGRVFNLPLRPSTTTPKAGSLLFFWLWLLFASLFLGRNSVTAECEEARCTANCSASLKESKMLMGVASVRLCVLLRQCVQCLEATGRACRGNLKFHSIRTMVFSRLNDLRRCDELLLNHAARRGEPPPAAAPFPAAGDTSPLYDFDFGFSIPRCSFRYQHQRGGGGGGFRYCTIFGDPHLRTFSGQTETCSTVGAWPVVDNSYFTAQITNEPVPNTVAASCISKVTLIIKGLAGCTDQKTYEATGAELPPGFVDGTRPGVEAASSSMTTEDKEHSSALRSYAFDLKRSTGGRGRPAIVIREVVPGEHVEILLRYISTRLTIRRVEGSLSLAVKMPEEVVAQESIPNALQLCLTGCPSGERIDFKEMLADPSMFLRSWGQSKPLMTRDEAEALCREAGTSDFFFDACVFDLVVTGDERYTRAAALALRDIRAHFPTYGRSHETNRSDLAMYDVLARTERHRRVKFEANLMPSSRSLRTQCPWPSMPAFSALLLATWCLRLVLGAA